MPTAVLSEPLSQIATAVGEQALITDPTELAYYAQDAFGQGATPLAVFRPIGSEMLARGIAAATAADVIIVPRDGA